MYRELKDGETKADHVKMQESTSSNSIQILSEWEMPRSNDPSACSVDHVLRLLQRLYAIAMEQDTTSNKFGRSQFSHLVLIMPIFFFVLKMSALYICCIFSSAL